jgi:dienelactone hydrolase
VGCRSFAERIGGGGHHVHVPDLYDGKTFPELTAGMAHAEQLGFDTITKRGRLAAERLPPEVLYVGISLGVLPAQMLAQTRPGARGAVLISGAVPPAQFGGDWRQGVPLQIHMMEADPLVAEEGDLDVARKLMEETKGAHLWLYSGDHHLFVDDSLPDYDEAATKLVIEHITWVLGDAPTHER